MLQTCHQSYVTRYTPHQQEECSEQYKKECQLGREKVEQQEMVEVCRTPLLSNCSSAGSPEGPEECRTMYESECWTKYEQHEVSEGERARLTEVVVLRWRTTYRSVGQ